MSSVFSGVYDSGLERSLDASSSDSASFLNLSCSSAILPRSSSLFDLLVIGLSVVGSFALSLVLSDLRASLASSSLVSGSGLYLCFPSSTDCTGLSSDSAVLPILALSLPITLSAVFGR